MMVNRCKGFVDIKAEDVDKVYNNFREGRIIASTIVPNASGFLNLFLFYEPFKEEKSCQVVETAKKEAVVPKLSDKQKLCPKCGKAIPKSWKFHQECGWKEEAKE